MRVTSRPFRVLTAIFFIALLLVALTSCAEAELDRGDEINIVETVNKLGSDYIVVFFPGLGIEPQIINSVAFRLGDLTVYWYGLIITCGIILAFTYASFMTKREGIKFDDLLDMAIWGIVCGVVGARLYYVLTSLDKFKGDFWSVFRIWEGGIAIYGAIIGGALALTLVCRRKKISVMKTFDAVAPAVMIGQIIGRWGNFMNGEAYGSIVHSDSFLYRFRMGIYPHTQLDSYISGIGGIVTDDSALAYVHPTFLYESVWNLIGLIIINVIYLRKKKFDGQIFFMYIAWYGLGRTFIELLRTDSLYIFETIRISSLVGCLCFFFGLAMLIYGEIKGKKLRLAGEEYESAYPLFHSKKATAEVAEKPAEAVNEMPNKEETNEERSDESATTSEENKENQENENDGEKDETD